ncbi:sulfide:quinone oxidoreductase, mitochondrial [Agrilus planipennis]|uniref:Sulfide:quinone oxidoreductase, mitochondrial n=1 Tax=Agrilus planipennis TaxID=224129 RepID=A0A1W4XSK2_AGRPL|nr:sulfide:quinone oxidoreductase, mitochondrial [Agrilus planipennis]
MALNNIKKLLHLSPIGQNISINARRFKSLSCKVLIVGGGSGGCSVSAKFSKILKKHELIIVEPSDIHYYQALFTLVGAGIRSLKDSLRSTASVLPKNSTWIKDSVVEFKPETNSVLLSNGDQITYDYIVISTGLILHFEEIVGLNEALTTPYVCSNYSPEYVENTYKVLQKLESGNAVFTYPDSPVKCPGAPQKICYLTEDYLRINGKRDKVNIYYNTSLPVIFGVKRYADALWKIVENRGIHVNLRTNLVKIDPDKRIAYFENLDNPDIKTQLEYNMLHVTPPMSPPNVIKKNKLLVNEAGFVDVDKNTLQHIRFPNVFSLGDCCSTPNSKTAAAIGCQSKVLYDNINCLIDGKKMSRSYNGYASCPLVTGYNSCILAEFDYDLQPLETLPFRQDQERWIFYFLKKDILPPLYWHLMLRGVWNGPGIVRKLLRLKLK